MNNLERLTPKECIKTNGGFSYNSIYFDFKNKPKLPNSNIDLDEVSTSPIYGL